MGSVGAPVGRLRVAVVGRPHVPAGSQGLQVGLLEGAIEVAAAVAHLQQGNLLSDGGVVGEIVEVAVGEGMVELAEGSLLSGQPGVELGQGVVGRVIAGDEALGFKSVNVPHRLVGPLEAAQGHECPLGGGRAGLGPQVGPLLRTEPVGVVGEGQEVEAVGAAHGVGVSRWAAAVGVGGMGVEAAEVGPHPAGEGRGRRRLGRGRRVRGGAGVGPVNGEINSHVVRVVQAHPLQGAGLRGRESARHPCGGVVAVAEGDGVQDLISWAEEQDLVARVGEGPLARGPGVVGDHVRHGQGVGVVASRDDHLEVGRGAEAGLELGGVLGHHDQALRPDCRPIGEASHPLAATLLLLVAHLVADEGHSLIRGVAQLHELVPLGGGGSSVVEHLADEEGNDGDRCRRGSRGWAGLRSGGGRCRSHAPARRGSGLVNKVIRLVGVVAGGSPLQGVTGGHVRAGGIEDGVVVAIGEGIHGRPLAVPQDEAVAVVGQPVADDPVGQDGDGAGVVGEVGVELLGGGDDQEAARWDDFSG